MELLQQATTIMVLGMGLVFAFLGLVVLAMQLAAYAIHRIEGAPRDDGPGPGGPAASEAGGRRAAAIAAALARMRKIEHH
jgi:sodium pump decarboxylase gamma subunit